MHQGKFSRVIIDRFEKGEDVLECLNKLVGDNHISSGSFIGIGSVQRAEIGFFVGNGKYSVVTCNGPLEVSSCVGNVASKEGTPFVHAHICLADRQGKAFGGHLMQGCIVDATFEVLVHEFEGLDLRRKLDSTTGLFLLDT